MEELPLSKENIAFCKERLVSKIAKNPCLPSTWSNKSNVAKNQKIKVVTYRYFYFTEPWKISLPKEVKCQYTPQHCTKITTLQFNHDNQKCKFLCSCGDEEYKVVSPQVCFYFKNSKGKAIKPEKIVIQFNNSDTILFENGTDGNILFSYPRPELACLYAESTSYQGRFRFKALWKRQVRGAEFYIFGKDNP
jgi:hypothetical protein